MNLPHLSKIGILTKEELQRLVDTSASKGEILTKLGLRPIGGNYHTLYKYLIFHEISLDLFKINNSKMNTNMKTNALDTSTSLEEILLKCTNNGVAKRHILLHNAIPYKCSECPIIDTYNGKEIVLHLDHIDGNHKNYTLTNLRFLCPNCHSQTDTYAGRNIQKRNVKEITIIPTISTCNCGNPKDKKSKKCKTCDNIHRERNKKFIVEFEELSKLVQTYSLEKVGKMFGVSGNAIKKRCKKLGIATVTFREYLDRIKLRP